LHADNDLWTHCAAVRGQGYRNRVAQTLEQEGLEDDARAELLEILEDNIQKEWEAKVIDQFRKLAGV
jgi:hypothetical protein